jgi:DNA primase
MDANRIDWDGIRSRLDCREVISSELGDSHVKTGKSWMYCCPAHHERRPSFSVFVEGFKCFSCGFSGDVFKWVEWRQGMGRAEAAAWLVQQFHLDAGLLGGLIRAPRLPQPARPRQPAVQHEDHTTPPSAEWQIYAERLVQQAQDLLWSAEGDRAMTYLLQQRGLSSYTIKAARLGYVRAQSQDEYKFGRVFSPEWVLDGKPVRAHAGITIPHYADGKLWGVRLRRPPGVEGAKYVGIRGGSKALYWVDQITPRLPVMVFEGEFDALVAWQVFGPGNDVECCPLALASASNHVISNEFIWAFNSCKMIYIRMDGDAAGSTAAQKLAASMRRPVQTIAVPSPHKDLTDFHQSCGSEAVRSWAAALLEGMR